jgi:large subunit ribosomal protein L10
MAIKAANLKDYKVEAVNTIKDYVGQVKDIIFTDFRGLNVGQITELRKQLREKEATLKVIKNNFARIALSELGMPDVSSFLTGPTAITLVKNDTSAVAKVLLDNIKETNFRVKGGLVGKKVFSEQDIQALSKLPAKEILLAMLMGTMQAPLQNFVYALNGVTQKFVRTLQAVADKKANEGK